MLERLSATGLATALVVGLAPVSAQAQREGFQIDHFTPVPSVQDGVTR